MKINLKSRKMWLVACGLWLVACGFAGNKAMSQGGNAEVSKITTVRNIGSYPSVIRTALVRKIIHKNGTNEIKFDEISKFDLSLPQSPDYKNDKEWSIFSKKDALDVEGYNAVAQSVTEKEGRYITTLSNRILGVGTDRPELLAILPNLKQEVCEAIIRNINSNKKVGETVTIPKLENPPNLLPHPQIDEASKIITLPENPKSLAGCVEAKGINYYYQVLLEDSEYVPSKHFNKKGNPSEISRTTSETFQSYPSAVRGMIFRIFNDRGIVKNQPNNRPFSPTFEDIQRLSFVMPGEHDYGSHPNWEVFGEKNGGKAMLESFRRKMDRVLPGGRFYITLSNKVTGRGSERPELIAIFPQFPADLCDDVMDDVFEIPEGGLKIPVSDPPNLLPPPAIAEDIGTVPLLEGWPYEDMVLGCFRDQNDVHYYYQVLFSF